MLKVVIDNVSFDHDRNKWITYYKVIDDEDDLKEACTGICLYSSVNSIFEENIKKTCEAKVLKYIEKRDKTKAAILAVSTFNIEAKVSQKV